MKTKFFVLVLCLSFVLLTAASGTITIQKGMCQGFGYDFGAGYSATGGIVAGALLNLSGYGNGLTVGYSAQGHIIAGALSNVGGTGGVVAGLLLHRSGFPSMSIPGQNSLQDSWGMRTADYYFHDFFLNPLLGLGNYMNYMGGLQFEMQGSYGLPSTQLYSKEYQSYKLLPQYIQDVLPAPNPWSVKSLLGDYFDTSFDLGLGYFSQWIPQGPLY